MQQQSETTHIRTFLKFATLFGLIAMTMFFAYWMGEAVYREMLIERIPPDTVLLGKVAAGALVSFAGLCLTLVVALLLFRNRA